jgi:hypothetical protein
LLPAKRDAKSALPPAVDADSAKRLFSNKPKYVVLARKAKITIVWMGWIEARLDIARRKGAMYLSYQPGFETGWLFSPPRHRDGREEAPSIVLVARIDTSLVFSQCDPKLSQCAITVASWVYPGSRKLGCAMFQEHALGRQMAAGRQMSNGIALKTGQTRTYWIWIGIESG